MKFGLHIPLFVFFLLMGASADAQEYPVNNEKRQAFLVTVYAGNISGPLVGGQFCPVKDQIVKQCESFLGNKGFYPQWSATVWRRNNGERQYHIGLAHAKLKVASGRYYMMGQKLQNGYLEVGNTTYFADLSPGTVIVYTRGNIPTKNAIAYAKQQLSKKMGEKILALRFIPGGAVAVSCSGADKNKACRVGKQINLNRVSLTGG